MGVGGESQRGIGDRGGAGNGVKTTGGVRTVGWVGGS